MSLFSPSYWLKILDKNIVSKSSLYYYILHEVNDRGKNYIEGDTIFCAGKRFILYDDSKTIEAESLFHPDKIILDDRNIIILDKQGNSFTYYVMLYPSKKSWYIVGGTALLAGAIISYLKHI